MRAIFDGEPEAKLVQLFLDCINSPSPRPISDPLLSMLLEYVWQWFEFEEFAIDMPMQ